MTGYFTDNDEDEYDDEKSCPHRDILLMFAMYRSQDWDSDEIVEEIVHGLAVILSTAPLDHQADMIRFVQENLPEFVKGEAIHTAVGQAKYNTQH